MCFKVSWHGRFPAGVQKFSSQRKRLAAGWVWLRCQKEMERKINGLFVRSTFLWSPPPSPSGRYPLMYRWSPGTGRLIFLKPLCWLVWHGLSCGVGHWLMGWEGDSRLLLIDLFKHFPLFMVMSSAKEKIKKKNTISLPSILLNNDNIRSKALWTVPAQPKCPYM